MRFIQESFGWGTLLWLFGYILGIVLFMLVPVSLVGWIIMPIGTVVTLWVLLKKMKRNSFLYYISLAVVWTLIAIVLDFIFLVQLFKPADEYYKFDVYVYYVLTFVLPVIIGVYKNSHYEHI